MEYPHKTLEIIFLVETSSNMAGSKIGTVNATMEELISEIRDIADERLNSKVNIRCISYSTGSKWRCLEHIPAKTFRWEYLEAEGKCDLGSGLLRLNKFLQDCNMTIDTYYRPIIFLFNASLPTDNIKYAMFKISENEWFKKALRVGILIGDNHCKNVLEQFTGNLRNVLSNHSTKSLRRWIQFFETK